MINEIKTMIYDEICTYEVAKLAKEKGFDEATYYTYEEESKRLNRMRYCVKRNSRIGSIIKLIAAPTQSLLQRWLREERGIVVEVIAQPTCSTSKKNCYWWSVKQYSDGFCYQYEECSYLLYSDEGYFAAYELALEDALKYALENLV